MPEGPQTDGVAADAVDPWSGDPRLTTFFGEAWDAVSRFHQLLVDEGEIRGLVGPREVARLWERHLLNSAAVVPLLPARGVVVDVGSGAGLPGIVMAAMRPALKFVLVEPMERRVAWLHDVVDATGLANVEIRRARAQELDGAIEADVVTARAVASLDKLFRWTTPLVQPGGQILAMKGARAADELDAARKVMRSLGLSHGQVHEVTTIDGAESTRVVSAVREGAARVR